VLLWLATLALLLLLHVKHVKRRFGQMQCSFHLAFPSLQATQRTTALELCLHALHAKFSAAIPAVYVLPRQLAGTACTGTSLPPCLLTTGASTTGC
jgi:hypothetical protein